MTAAAEARRVGRDGRRNAVADGSQRSEPRSQPNDLRSEIANLGQSVRERVGEQTSPRIAAATAGAAVGVVAALVAKALKTNDQEGNDVSGEVTVHLLNKIELLTIRLHVRHARRSVRTEIDVHRAKDDA